MSGPYQFLRQSLDTINPLADAAWAEVEQLVAPRMVAKGEHLLRAGERARSVFFVSRGLLREYYIDSAGHESTRRFCAEGEFSGSLADLLASGPAACAIEAIEPGEIWQVDWNRFDACTERHASLMKLMRRFAEALYVRKMQREFEMLALSADERYRRFVREFPGLESRLPRRMIASYLGITPVHLSRICAAGK
jgi:CRP-like cAMP-binding protein